MTVCLIYIYCINVIFCHRNVQCHDSCDCFGFQTHTILPNYGFSSNKSTPPWKISGNIISSKWVNNIKRSWQPLSICHFSLRDYWYLCDDGASIILWDKWCWYWNTISEFIERSVKRFYCWVSREAKQHSIKFRIHYYSQRRADWM
jgi:hypothetical protein